jgi:hypothetical protein
MKKILELIKKLFGKKELAGTAVEVKQEEPVVEPKPVAPKSSGQSQYRPGPGESMQNFMKRMGLNSSGGRRKTRLRGKNRRNKSTKRLRK